MSEHVVQCQVCAWREDCKKKFHLESQGGRVRCADFCEDLKIKTTKERLNAEKS